MLNIRPLPRLILTTALLFGAAPAFADAPEEQAVPSETAAPPSTEGRPKTVFDGDYMTIGAAVAGAVMATLFAIVAWLALGRSIGLPLTGGNVDRELFARVLAASCQSESLCPPRYNARPLV